MSMDPVAASASSLIDAFRDMESCVVAFSGGVDSAVVAKAAWLALGDRAWAVTGVSHSLPGGELDQARGVAEEIGIGHACVATHEADDEVYRRNDGQRCHACKHELYQRLRAFADERGLATIVNGTNLDDLGDFRPGLRAAQEWSVVSPLVELGYQKALVRSLARFWNLTVADKPAGPCLASRIAYGEEVTPDRLRRIDAAEKYLAGLGFREIRVRLHQQELARIEVPWNEVARLCEPEQQRALVSYFRSLGFRFVTLDLEGFRSGSLNTLIPAQLLKHVSPSE